MLYMLVTAGWIKTGPPPPTQNGQGGNQDWMAAHSKKRGTCIYIYICIIYIYAVSNMLSHVFFFDQSQARAELLDVIA